MSIYDGVPDSVMRRRASFSPVGSSFGWPRPSAPAQPGVPAASGGPTSGWAGAAGDPTMDAMIQRIMSRYGARSRGARLGALASSGEDASLGAYSGTQAGMSEQGDTSRGVNDAVSQLLMKREDQRWQEYMMRQRAELAAKQAREASKNAMWGNLASIGGKAALGFATGGASLGVDVLGGLSKWLPADADNEETW